MPRRGKRKRIARAIYEDKSGRSGIYRDADGRAREVRFPPGTPIGEIREDIDRRRGTQRGSGRASSDRGTLADAVDRWERLEKHLRYWKDRRSHLRAWVNELGHKAVRQITEHDVRDVIGRWTLIDYAPKTIRDRLWYLQHLYKVLYGPDVATPVDHIKPPAKVRHVPTPVSPDRILAVYQQLIVFEQEGRLRDAKTRARYMVRAATGRRPCEIMRIKVATDVDLDQRIWRVRDAKGGWSEGLYLNDDMVAAFELFIAADAEGEFDTGSMAEVLYAAGWPKGIRPYQLRHSLGIGLSEDGVDLADVGAWLGHKSLQTTRSAYVPVLNSRMERISKQIDGRLGGWKRKKDAR